MESNYADLNKNDPVIAAGVDPARVLPCTVDERTDKRKGMQSGRGHGADPCASPLDLGTETNAEKMVSVSMNMLPAVNFALQQNGIGFLESVVIENKSKEQIRDVVISITAAPEFIHRYTQRIDCLPVGKTLTIIRPEIVVNGDLLAQLTEKMTGTLRVTAVSGDTVLAENEQQITMLAYDQWQGLGIKPEITAAFMTPNHPELSRIIKRASEYLKQWTGNPSMDAYQSQDPNRALRQAAAIFAALKDESVTYVVPPAGFEEAGQRVRLGDAVLRTKLGTCLDLSLLYASCLEAIGLHPILIAVTGHMFTGVWLIDRMFPECVQDDASQITKRLASGINEIAVIETTCVCDGSHSDFDAAGVAGERTLAQHLMDCLVIDVKRARLSHISPIPQRIFMDDHWVVESTKSHSGKGTAAPEQLAAAVDTETGSKEEQLPKIVRWERKLLDLGTRNTLLNLRLTRTQIPLIAGSPEALEDALSDGSSFTVMPRPADMNIGDGTFEQIRELGSEQVISADFSNKRLRSALSENELGKSIKELYRSSKASLEETGANTLYLALGMLRWYETKNSTKARYAPIILLPVEMVRKSAAQGYVIRLRDDEPQMNITLLEKLKQDFGLLIGGVDPLPEDEKGVDVRKVLTIIRKAVMEQHNWDVIETATLGIFSFSQFVMWNDIRNRTEDLMRSKVVRSLIDGRLTWDAEPLVPGEHVDESGVLLPIPADASQLFAIRSACEGKSFVLHGPPGTGKSQTITSLIANALAQGKTVLFVAEKMAALEVVQRRLESIGIGRFCLELHSNKSKKKDVLEKLRQVTEVTKGTAAAAYTEKAETLSNMRKSLDTYARELHAVRPCGKDLYSLINDYEFVRDAKDLPPFSHEFLSEVTAEAIEQQTFSVERLVAAGREIGHPHGHPLSAVRRTQYSQSLRYNLPQAVSEYEKAIRTAIPSVRGLSSALNREQPCSDEDVNKLYQLAVELKTVAALPRGWISCAQPKQYFDGIRQLCELQIGAAEQKAALLEQFRPEFLNENGESLRAEYDAIAGAWFLPKFIGSNKLTGRMNRFAKSAIGKDRLESCIASLCRYQSESKAAEGLLLQYGEGLGELDLGGATDWQAILALAEDAARSSSSIFRQTGAYDAMRLCAANSELGRIAAEFTRVYEAYAGCHRALYELLHMSESREADWLEGQLDQCGVITEYSDSLKDWIAFSAAAEEAEKLGLDGVVAAYRAGMAHEDLPGAYKKTLLRGLIADAIDGSAELNSFSGPVLNKRIEQFVRMDREWTELSKEEIFNRLAGKVPDFTREAAQSSELGILQRAIRSNGRGQSIRKLFDQIPNLLPRLCPCMLMSPISAAQYLDPKRAPFDIVVFDEASQLPTCKAVGVLARGTDAVIVGDPKQMPPTSFFTSNTEDEENCETEDLESILDDCLALNMPQAYLQWHYRSRHESLIAFSNSQFYENRLFTFPSVNDRESKVRLIPVNGLFDRGKSRTNPAEAAAVVEELKRRCHDPLHCTRSVGVVTFNINQQHLIDDLLNEACKKDPALDSWAFGSGEPVFIKNLENVQGDERDVILFSVGYGPDENGRVSMNFGPLNREGGWRRLNVAVSRARCEMIVFSALRSDQIDTNRTKADGVAALRAFLEYAEGTAAPLGHTVGSAEGAGSDGIARAIQKELKAHGYESDLNIGHSDYRVDIGVVDPRDTDRYLMGILLDGKAYGKAKTTRDREVAQVAVLNGLGWKILRVWTMDWWDHRQKEMKRILEELEKTTADSAEQEESKEAAALPGSSAEQDLGISGSSREERNEPAERKRSVPLYRAAVLPVTNVTPEELIASFAGETRRRVMKVVNAEAPICCSLLNRRVIQSFGITRAGSRLQAHMKTVLESMNFTMTNRGEEQICWSSSQDPETYAGVRYNGEGDNYRDIREVPRRELINALCLVLYEQLGMSREDLLREGARRIGYTRAGTNVQNAFASAVASAAELGLIKADEQNGCLSLTASGSLQAERIMALF